MRSNKNSNFILQAGILAAAGFISRIIGLLYVSPVAAIKGKSEGSSTLRKSVRLSAAPFLQLSENSSISMQPMPAVAALHMRPARRREIQANITSPLIYMSAVA